MPPTVETGKPSGSGEQVSAPSGTSVSSGTASEAMIRAASAAAEPTTSTVGAQPTDTATATGEVKTDPTTAAPAKEEPKPAGTEVATSATTETIPEHAQARIKSAARTQAFADLGQAIGLDRAITREDLADLELGLGILKDLRNDPQAFFADLAARLGAKTGPAATDGKPKTYEFPAASLKAADGREAYSAKDVQSIISMVEEKLTEKFSGELKPLMDWRGKIETAEEKAENDRQARTLATSALTEARTALPHFKDNEAEIKATLAKMQPALIKQIGPIAAMYRAYNFVLKTKVFPGIDKAADERIRAEYAKKAGASSVVHPTGSGGEAKVAIRDGDVAGLAEHMAKLAAQPSL